MSHILIIDSTPSRSTAIAAQFQAALPQIAIYRCYTNNGQTYICDHYDTDGLFYRADLPPEPATLALWHYRDDRYIPTIEPKISMGFGGGGRESYPGFLHHVTPKLATPTDIRTILTIETIRDLWAWTSDPTQMPWSLQRLLKSDHQQSSLIALHILCQAYLTIYGDLQSPIADANALAQHRDRVNSHSWWLSALSAIKNWQDPFTLIPGSRTSECQKILSPIAEAIQHPDKWNDLNLRNICQQCIQHCP
jgi:hypothetical protein